MSNFLSLPPEILVLVYSDLERIKDAVQLALCCKQTYVLFRHWNDRLKIIHSIIDKKTLPESPSSGWLEARFGVDSLWKPKESELPPEISGGGNGEFLAAVGFPSMKCSVIDWDSSHLKIDAEKGDAMHAWDEDEIFARRYPDEEVEPTDFCYHFGTFSDQMVMVGAGSYVMDYNLGGFGESHDRGTIAYSIKSFLVLLGTLREVAMDVDSYLKGLCTEDPKQYEDTQTAVYEKLAERFDEYDADYRDCKFWEEMIEYVADW